MPHIVDKCIRFQHQPGNPSNVVAFFFFPFSKDMLVEEALHGCTHISVLQNVFYILYCMIRCMKHTRTVVPLYACECIIWIMYGGSRNSNVCINNTNERTHQEVQPNTARM